ncbi:microtubule associated protein [Cryptosporidium ubiquitum]|uniref:Microtubule associated protein n=1 Tax=Cryptosporidium ubiquitum TaxID=857276 RepID=A0A1J4MR17_9CRYT|nr:microtubule associated protein [Cryptosporidium ubiquitum]OII75333.1 microtubule associated protein [Cryptosporidium ubiquitum]
MKDDGELVSMVLDENPNFGPAEYSSENNDNFNGIDMSTIPINSLITSNEWQMRMYGYKKAIKEIESINICEFEDLFIKSIVNDKNISSQNLGIKLLTISIQHFGLKINNLPTIWKENISEMLIKKTLINSKTSCSSMNLAFSFFEQSLLIENGDLNKVDYLWNEMIDFINNNRKSKGIVIKQILGVVKLFCSFIENYGVEFSPIVKWSKAIIPLVTDCNDKSTKDCVYEILSMINQESSLMEYISSNLTPLQLKEVQKRSIELDEKKNKEPIRNDFVKEIKSRFNSNIINTAVFKENENSIDSFDLIEPVDVTKLLPSNWLEVISDKKIKWNERKLIIDQFSKLCEIHKKLSINQNDSKANISHNNKKNIAPSITDYQNLLNILQRIIKCEGNTALILSVIRLCSNLISCLRGKVTTIVRPLTTQILTKIKDQNKIVCTESINFVNMVLKFSLNLDQIFDDLYIYGYKEKVTTAKCSAISICDHLIDEIIENNSILEKHSKGLKQLINIIPSCFDDPSIQVRSSASVLLVKLKNPCFGEEFNTILQKVITGLHISKQKLINETERKLGIHLYTTKDENNTYTKNFHSKTLSLSIKTTNPPPNSTITTPNNESTKSNRNSIPKIGIYKQIETQNKGSINIERLENTNNNQLFPIQNVGGLSKSDGKTISNSKSTEGSNEMVNESKIHNSETLPTILNSISSTDDKKINFFERLSNKRPLNLQTSTKLEKQNFYYIDPTDCRNFIVNLPEAEIIFETHETDLLSLKNYIKPFISDQIFINMFSNDNIQIDFSISFWERFCNFLRKSRSTKFTLFYFFFRWISYNIEMEIAANYERIIVSLINVFSLQGREYYLKYNSSMIYNIIAIVINIIIKEIQIFDKSNILSDYEIAKYEKIVFLIMEKGSISNPYYEEEKKQESFNLLTNTSFLMNTIINSSLEKLEKFDKKINLINNHLNILNNSSNFLKNYGISNIHSLIHFMEKNLSNIEIYESTKKILSRISNNIGIKLWNTLLMYFPDIPVDKYYIKNISEPLSNKIDSNLLIINSLEYETIKLFNIIGSTGNPKDTGVLLYNNILIILTKIMTNLDIINNKLNYILENNHEIARAIVDNNFLNSLLIEHIIYFSEISIHIYFLLTKLEANKYNMINKILKLERTGELFFKAIEHLDKFTSIFQTVVIKEEFPIKELMANTLFIMSNYLFWKEYINDENQKVKLVNSLNNIMGVNIILSFQKELPRLVNIIIEVMLFGIKPNNCTIFDHDLLNRLLPKVLRRMKVYLSNNNISDVQIKNINHCFELMNNTEINSDSHELIIIDFALDYLSLLLESGLDIQNYEGCKLFLSKISNKSNKDNFQDKIRKIKLLT